MGVNYGISQFLSLYNIKYALNFLMLIRYVQMLSLMSCCVNLHCDKPIKRKWKRKPKSEFIYFMNKVILQVLVTVSHDDPWWWADLGGGHSRSEGHHLPCEMHRHFPFPQVTHPEKSELIFHLPFIPFSQAYLPLSCERSDILGYILCNFRQ